MTPLHRHLAIACSIAALLGAALAVPIAGAKKPVKPPDTTSTTTTDPGTTTTTDPGTTTTTDPGTTTTTTDPAPGTVICATSADGCDQVSYQPPAECDGLTDEDAHLYERYFYGEVVLTDEQLALYQMCFSDIYWVLGP